MARQRARAFTQQELVTLLRANAQRWPELPNVTSVGVGYRVRRGRRTSTLAIQVTVSKKMTPSELRAAGLEPLPKFIPSRDGRRVPVDIIERSYRPSYVLVPEPASGTSGPPPAPASPALKRRRRLARIMPGISVGHLNTKGGSLGAIVYDKRTGRPCMLSNAHVLQGNTGTIGDTVLQPGRTDDGDVGNNASGTLLRSHFGLAGDCAIAGIETRLFDEAVLELGVAPKRLAKVAIGDRVVKSGRTTGVTRGEVVRIGVVISIDYGGHVGVQQIGGFEVGPIPGAPPPNGLLSDEGDSGSLWMIDQAGGVSDIAAGLHFAQQTDPMSQAEHALACNIHSVFEKLDVTFTSFV
jgi:endonuclease G